jgi:serine/threonine-protein kinase RsbW
MASKSPISSTVTVESRASAIVDVCKRILSTLQSNSFSQDDMFAVHLALEEAFLNAIRHGNEMDPDKKVTIDYSVDLDKVEISLTDQGAGFNPEAVPDPRIGKNIYKPEGRGLFLINSYMDVVKFNELGNKLYMVRYKEKPSLTESQGQKQA